MKTSFSATVRTLVVILLAWSFQACDKKADSLVQPENGRESLSNPSIMPQVVSTVPSNYGTGPFKIYAPGPASSEPHFILQFNKYMNLASIKELTVTCDGFSYPVRVVVTDNYYWYWSRGLKRNGPINPGSAAGTVNPFRELIGFQIIRTPGYYRSANYDIGKTYTVTIDSTIEDINGNHLSTPFSFSYTPEPSFRSTGTYPSDGSTDNNMYYSNVSVYFNSPITNALMSSIHVTPAVAGTWDVNLNDSLSASLPNVNQSFSWDFGMTYQITVDAGATDARGNVLAGEVKSIFSTAPFKVTNTDPPDGAAMSYLSNSVQISFNANLDTSTIRSAITLSPSPPGSMIYDFYYGSSYVYLRPWLGYNGGKTYSVTIAPTLKAQNGAAFPNPFVFYFATEPFRVRYINPPNGAGNVNRSSPIQIETNGAFNQTTLASSISISPAASLYWYANGSNSFSSSGTLAASTTYTVTMLSSFRSTAGDSLAAPYSFTFTTGP